LGTAAVAAGALTTASTALQFSVWVVPEHDNHIPRIVGDGVHDRLLH